MTPTEQFLGDVKSHVETSGTVYPVARLFRMVERLRISLEALCENIPSDYCPGATCDKCHVRKALDYDGK